MSYEPPEDFLRHISKILLANSRLQIFTATKPTRNRSQSRARHEHLEALIQLAFLRLEPAQAAALYLQLDAILRQREEERSAQNLMAKENSELLAEVRQSLHDLRNEVSDFRHTVIPMLPRRYGDPGPYRILPGEGLNDPESVQEAEAEQRQRNGETLEG